MLRHSIVKEQFILMPRERIKCYRITSFVIIQCLMVFGGSYTVFACVWSPDNSTEDLDKLARIMYLYDSDACGRHFHSSMAISHLVLSNHTRGLNVLPIRCQPPTITVSAKFSTTTRWYLNISIALHVIWMLSDILLRIFLGTTRCERYLKPSLTLFFCISIAIVIFDLSMAIVYASHIKKSLTKGMILRYSGWSVKMKLENYTDFGGWIPIAAAICWMRGIVVMFVNIYCIRSLHKSMRGIQKREVRRRLTMTENEPLPEAKSESPSDDAVLYYRTGEYIPYTGINKRDVF